MAQRRPRAQESEKSGAMSQTDVSSSARVPPSQSVMEQRDKCGFCGGGLED